MAAERKPPVHIPLDFNTAVDGLLRVDPRKLPATVKKAVKPKPAKKAAPKRAPKKKG